ncbi:hypothetical protein TrVE_jg12922 [Triparma verrucosa]|uniref:Uncharacterized protein n=1 Tax=Triparma verrucosa TaxID=1606542 RepID=A0A9W7EZN3_9STRA|nr:hypothetical protein TrVE_jg12922 [Triparma verrucosa]
MMFRSARLPFLLIFLQLAVLIPPLLLAYNTASDVSAPPPYTANIAVDSQGNLEYEIRRELEETEVKIAEALQELTDSQLEYEIREYEAELEETRIRVAKMQQDLDDMGKDIVTHYGDGIEVDTVKLLIGEECVPIVSTIEVRNTSPEEFTLLSLTSDTPVGVRLPPFSPHTLAPMSSHTLKIVYLPLSPDEGEEEIQGDTAVETPNTVLTLYTSISTVTLTIPLLSIPNDLDLKSKSGYYTLLPSTSRTVTLSLPPVSDLSSSTPLLTPTMKNSHLHITFTSPSTLGVQTLGNINFVHSSKTYTLPITIHTIPKIAHTPLLDFGILTRKDSLAHLEISLYNPSSNPITLSSIRSTSPHFTVDGGHLHISPFSHSSVRVKFTGVSEGDFSAQIHLNGNQTGGEIITNVKGECKYGGIAWHDEDIFIRVDGGRVERKMKVYNVFKEGVRMKDVTSECVEVWGGGGERGFMEFWEVEYVYDGESSQISEDEECGMWLVTDVSRHWVPIFLYSGRVIVDVGEPERPRSKIFNNYIDLLYYSSSDVENVNRVVVDMGGLAGNVKKTKSVWVRNPNPVQVNLTVGGEVESLRIRPGHVKKSVLDVFNLSPYSNIISEVSHSYTTQINVLDVRFSSTSKSDLEYLYDKYAGVQVNSHSFEKEKRGGVVLEPKKEWKKTNNNNIAVMPTQTPGQGEGVLISVDGRFEKKLNKVNPAKKSSKNNDVVVIPPGGEVRLDVECWTGDSDVLRGDATKFIGTGLEFNTEEETFKVAVTYESVMGQFEVGPFEFEKYFTAERGDNEKLSNLHFTPKEKLKRIKARLSKVRSPRDGENFFSMNPSNPYIHKIYMHLNKMVPTRTKSGDEIQTLKMTPIYRTGIINGGQINGVKNLINDEVGLEPYIDLVVKSTFNDVVKVENVKSCNPWFQVDYTNFYGNLMNYPSDEEAYNKPIPVDGDPAPVARLYHKLKCGEDIFDQGNTTFTREIMFWECAKIFMEQKNDINQEGCASMIKTKAETTKEVEIEKRAYTAVEKFVDAMKEARQLNEVNLFQLQQWKEAKSAWQEYEKHDLNVLATAITVTPDVAEPTTSPPLIVTSRLSVPKVNLAKQGEVVFENTRVGSEGIGYVFVENPSGDPISVSLIQLPNDEGCWIQTKNIQTNSWYTGGSWFMLSWSDRTPILQAGYGASVRTPPGTPVMKSIHGISMLLRGCGRRCGVKGETTTPTALFAPITPISTENEEGSMYRITKPQPFAVSFDAFKSVQVDAYGVKRIGPIFFKPWGQGDFHTDLYIKNDLTGLEKVTLRGRGVSNYLAFSALPMEENGKASDIVVWEGEKMLKFEPGLPSYDGEAKVTKKVRLSNPGGHQIKIKHIELQTRINRPTKERIWTFAQPLGFFDMFPPLDYSYIPYFDEIKARLGAKYGWGHPSWGGTPAECHSRGFNIVNCEEARHDFVLEYGEHIDIEIEHWPECGEPFSYTHLNVNMIVAETFYGRPQKGLYVESRSMKIGYAASEADMEHCISSMDVLKYQWRPLTVFITSLFIFMAFVYLYFVSLDVLYRHDYMLRVEATWQRPIISCYDELQSDLKHITSSSPDLIQLDAWAKTRVADMMKTRTTPPTPRVPLPKLFHRKNMFGNLEGHDEDRNAVRCASLPLGVDLNNTSVQQYLMSSEAKTYLESNFGGFRAHLTNIRGHSKPVGAIEEDMFPKFFASLKTDDSFAAGKDSSKSVKFRSDSRDYEEEGEEGAGAGTPPRLITEKTLRKSQSSSSNASPQTYVRSGTGSLSKEERRALAAEQQRQALAEKEEKRREDEAQKRAAVAKKKLKKEQEELARKNAEEAKEKLLEEQRLEEENQAKKILEEEQRQEEEALKTAKLMSLKMEQDRLEKEKLIIEQRWKVEEEAKRLAVKLEKAQKEEAKKAKEEAKREKKKKAEEKAKAEKKARKLELEVKKEQDKQLNKVKELILLQKGVAEVQWLIAMSLTDEMGIKGVFTSPSDVARFCILHSDFELRREANMDFIVMKSLLPPTDSNNPPLPPPGVSNQNLPPLPPNPQPLPLPPPGMMSPPGLNQPLPSTPQPSPVGGSALPNHSVLSSGGSSLPFPSPPPSLTSPLTGAEGMNLESLLGGENPSVGLSHASSSSSLPRRSSSGISDSDEIAGDLLGGSDNFDMMNLLPSDIADFVMEDNEGDLWNSGAASSSPPKSSSVGGLGSGTLGGLGGLGGKLGGLGGGLGGLGGSSLLTPDSLLAGLNSTSFDKDEQKDARNTSDSGSGPTVQKSSGNSVYGAGSFFE